MLKRSISGGSTKLTAYAFGLQELSYTGSGAYSGQTDYYSIAGHLLGSTNGTATTYDLTDAEGSVLTTLSSSAVLGEQIYGPYGNQRYTQGTMGTDKGYTGQFQDAVSGFDYYNARYYDPVMGQFLSADNVQGNAQGMDPYSYVNGNPETATDPTGQAGVCAWCGDTGIAGGSTAASGSYPTPSHGCGPCGAPPGFKPQPPAAPQPTPTSTPTPTKTSTGTSTSAPKKKPWCFTVCGGVANWWTLGEGFAGFMGNSAALAILIAAFTGAEASTDGAATFAANFVAGAGLQLIRNIINGIRGMVDSFTEHNPVLDIFSDILSIILDLGTLVAAKGSFSAIKEAGGIQSSLQVARFGASIATMLSGQQVQFTKYLGPAVSWSLGVVSVIGAGTGLIQDGLQLGNDITEYNSYAVNHDPSAGWNAQI